MREEKEETLYAVSLVDSGFGRSKKKVATSIRANRCCKRHRNGPLLCSQGAIFVFSRGCSLWMVQHMKQKQERKQYEKNEYPLAKNEQSFPMPNFSQFSPKIG